MRGRKPGKMPPTPNVSKRYGSQLKKTGAETMPHTSQKGLRIPRPKKR